MDLFVEEPSAEAFLRTLFPRILPRGCRFNIFPFQGKGDLLAKLEARLRAYVSDGNGGGRIIVLVDRDRDDCLALKRRLDEIARRVGLATRTEAGQSWRVANRIAVEELEAWYFGDWEAVKCAFPKASLSKKESSRNPNSITGGTWEHLERVLQRAGYFKGGLRKLELARKVGANFEPARCTSLSFRKFLDAVIEAQDTETSRPWRQA